MKYNYPIHGPHGPQLCVKKVPFPVDFCSVMTTHVYWVAPRGEEKRRVVAESFGEKAKCCATFICFIHLAIKKKQCALYDVLHSIGPLDEPIAVELCNRWLLVSDTNQLFPPWPYGQQMFIVQWQECWCTLDCDAHEFLFALLQF